MLPVLDVLREVPVAVLCIVVLVLSLRALIVGIASAIKTAGPELREWRKPPREVEPSKDEAA